MLKISEILAFLREEEIPFIFDGDETVTVEGFSSLTHYKPGSFTWIKTQKNIPENFDLIQIRLAFISEEVEGEYANSIKTSQSKKAFFSTIEHFYGLQSEKPAIGQFTYISPEVKLGKNVRIGHNCTLDGNITIGDNTVIWNNVVIINQVSIGHDCEIQSGTVIGHDGFAYTEDENHTKTMVKHYGGVEIGDNVYIGADVIVDRAQIDRTMICAGCKIDPLVHIAHNVVLGKNSTVIACANIMGSVSTGENAYISSSTVRNQIKIGSNAVVGMGAVVVKNVPDNTTVVGNPAKVFEK